MVGHTRVIRVGGPPLVYVCVHVHTRPSTGANTHTDRLSTQACWRHNKSFKNPQKNVGQIKKPLKALWDKGCSHVEPPLRQSPIETMLVLALTLFCVYIIFWVCYACFTAPFAWSLGFALALPSGRWTGWFPQHARAIFLFACCLRITCATL